MPTEEKLLSVTQLEAMCTEGAGHDVLRYISLPEILGPEAHMLLYYTGKNLARKFDIQTFDDIYYIFHKLGWGTLDFIKKKQRYMEFHLRSDAVVQRLEADFETEFRLEAGFLAAAAQAIDGIGYECIDEINSRIHQVSFKIYKAS